MLVCNQEKLDQDSQLGKRPTDRVFVNRQPIYGAHFNLLAYELLSQVRQTTLNEPVGADQLRADLGTFSEVGLDQIAGDHLAFVAVSREAIVGGFCDALSKRRVVLEVLGNIVFDDEIHDALANLAAKGYKIAIDSRGDRDPDPRLASIADIIRIDVSNLDEWTLRKRIDAFSKLSVQLLASNIGRLEEFNLCKKHDFDYFQGHFFYSPNRPSRKVPANRLAAIRVLAELQNPEISINQLAVTISHDLSLSYKLLRYTNSAYIGLSRQVESISHAAKMIGIERIRVWASLLMVAKMEDKPRELMTTAIVRAAMCERLATSAKAGRRETFFTVGLLSLLDALLDLPMVKAVDKLPLSDEVCDALLRHEGRLGQALSCVLAYERGDWDQVQFEGLPGMTVRAHYLDSVGWARRISDGLLI